MEKMKSCRNKNVRLEVLTAVNTFTSTQATSQEPYVLSLWFIDFCFRVCLYARGRAGKYFWGRVPKFSIKIRRNLFAGPWGFWRAKQNLGVFYKFLL